MKKIVIKIGTKVKFNGNNSVIVKIVDIDTITIEEIHTNIIHTVSISSILPCTDGIKQNEIFTLSDKKWDKAVNRYNIIKPIIENKGSKNIIEEVSLNNKISIATIYRWLNLYNSTNLVSSLAGKVNNSNHGVSKLTLLHDQIIYDKINLFYLSNKRNSITKTIREIQMECLKKNIVSPHSNTIRNRIKNLSEEEKIRKRYGVKEAKEKFEPIKGSFPGAEFPLSIVQIDHTPVDIILVDEINRNPYQRPWLTLAIDVNSRLVVGFYLSFDPPSAFSVGACIANSILPKEMWLEKCGVSANWPCWGIMDAIHLDNAKEFHSNMLKKACLEYGINIMYRPIATPHFGGHIERLLGTFSKEIHNLPGTTFSSKEEKGNYNSTQRASLTLSEFEKWLMVYITKVYHNKIHSSILTTPLEKFKKGIVGTDDEIGKGIPPRIFNERRVRLDFMPFIERTIQEYGVVNDHIYYYNDILRPYINSIDSKGNKIKYLFRIDPRDISTIYFFDPKFNDYFEISYRNTSFPPISIWEYRDVVKKLRFNKVFIDEKSIFEAYAELNDLESISNKKTKQKKNKNFIQNKEILKDTININTELSFTYNNIKEIEKNSWKEDEKQNIVLPFEDIDY